MHRTRIFYNSLFLVLISIDELHICILFQFMKFTYLSLYPCALPNLKDPHYTMLHVVGSREARHENVSWVYGLVGKPDLPPPPLLYNALP